MHSQKLTQVPDIAGFMRGDWFDDCDGNRDDKRDDDRDDKRNCNRRNNRRGSAGPEEAATGCLPAFLRSTVKCGSFPPTK